MVKIIPDAPQCSINAEKPWVSEARSPGSDSTVEKVVQART
jgi:hypothetical protein